MVNIGCPLRAADLPGQRILGYLSAFARDVQRFFARKTRIYTISASGRHDSYFAIHFSHERHEYTRFPQAEDTILRSIRALKIVLSTCRHRIIRA